MPKRRHRWVRRRSQSISEYAILVVVIIAFVLVGSTGLTTALRSAAENVLGNDYAPPPPPASPSPSPIPPPVADFSGAPTSGPAPLTVAFTDASTNNPTSWSWTFGDGGVSTAQHPSYTYTTPGTYNVSLTVFNGSGSDTITKVNYITVGPPPPVADFSGTPTTGYLPLTVNFTDLSTGGAPTAWSWDFGDGGTSNDQNPTHTYSNPGTYDVTLTVSNASGSNTVAKSGYITVQQATVRWASSAYAGSNSLDSISANGTITPGDLLVIFAMSETTSPTIPTITSPGWTTAAYYNGGGRQDILFYKIAAGSETSVTFGNKPRVALYVDIQVPSIAYSGSAVGTGAISPVIPSLSFSGQGLSLVWLHAESGSGWPLTTDPTVQSYSAPINKSVYAGGYRGLYLWMKPTAAGTSGPYSSGWPSGYSPYYTAYGQIGFTYK
jgi:PKD repeat protein